MATEGESRFVAGLRSTAEDTLRQGGKLLAGALLSGTVVALQYLVSRAAESGGGPSHLGNMPFTTYVDFYAFGYVALVTVVALALVFADSVEDAIRFTVVPIAFGLLVQVVMLMLQAANRSHWASYFVVAAFWLFWAVVCWIAAPPLADRRVLRTLAPLASWSALRRWTSGNATAVSSMTDMDRRRSIDRSAQRMIVLCALFALQLVISFLYSRQTASSNPFDFDPRPQSRLDESKRVLADTTSQLWNPQVPDCAQGKNISCADTLANSLVPRHLRRRDGLARLRTIDSLTNGMVLQQEYVKARYCDSPLSANSPPSSNTRSPANARSPANTPPFDAAWYRAARGRNALCDRSVAPSAGDITRLAFNSLGGSIGSVGQIVSAEIALHDELIRTEWARAIDDRHRWLMVMLGLVLVALAVCLAFGPKEGQLALSHRFRARVRLNEREAISGRFTPNERALGALVVVILSIVPLVRTVNPDSLSTAKPRSVFGGTSWSPVEVPSDSAKKAKEADVGKNGSGGSSNPDSGKTPLTVLTKDDLLALQTALQGKLTTVDSLLRKIDSLTKERLDLLEGLDTLPNTERE